MESSHKLPASTLLVKKRVLSTTVVPTMLPPLTEQIANASHALLRAGKALLTGRPLQRSQAQQEACLAVCAACDRWDDQAGRCLECGCYMALKSRLATEQCPLGRWPDFDNAAASCPPPAKA